MQFWVICNNSWVCKPCFSDRFSDISAGENILAEITKKKRTKQVETSRIRPLFGFQESHAVLGLGNGKNARRKICTQHKQKAGYARRQWGGKHPLPTSTAHAGGKERGHGGQLASRYRLASGKHTNWRCPESSRITHTKLPHFLSKNFRRLKKKSKNDQFCCMSYMWILWLSNPNSLGGLAYLQNAHTQQAKIGGNENQLCFQKPAKGGGNFLGGDIDRPTKSAWQWWSAPPPGGLGVPPDGTNFFLVSFDFLRRFISMWRLLTCFFCMFCSKKKSKMP